MDLIQQYRRQYAWRDWKRVYDTLPDMSGKKILDLGCALGDQSADFSQMGADVVGVDANPDLIDHARSRALPNAEFYVADFTDLNTVLEDQKFDLIWSSFSAAYFTDQANILRYWAEFIKDGGRIVLVEMSDLLNHNGVMAQYECEIAAFYKSAFESATYDFLAGARLKDSLREAGFVVTDDLLLNDSELNADGILNADVQDAWAHRFERMGGLKLALGEDFISLFLEDINQKDHISNCNVHAIIAQINIFKEG